jgi:sortase A
LPVPSAPAQIVELPGDGPSRATVSAAGPPPAAGARVTPGDWVARLDAASVGLSATVIEGSTDQMLARAAGHIENTAFPGEAGNAGIAGHRDTTFRAVRKLQVGDRLRITTLAGSFDYRVDRTFIVKPEDVYVLAPTATPTLTLVTCYPFTFIGHAPKRYIVQATLVGQ